MICYEKKKYTCHVCVKRESGQLAYRCSAQSNLNNWNFFGTTDIFRGTSSSSHWGLIVAPGQEANGDNSRNIFDLLDNNDMFSVLIRIALMTYNFLIKYFFLLNSE